MFALRSEARALAEDAAGLQMQLDGLQKRMQWQELAAPRCNSWVHTCILLWGQIELANFFNDRSNSSVFLKSMGVRDEKSI